MSSTHEKFLCAIAARDRGDFRLAEELLLSRPDDETPAAAHFAVLAQVQWQNQKLEQAIETFRQAVALAPNAESVSLGLFHCLLENGQTDAAFAEMKRFLATNSSVEYTQLLNEINGCSQDD